MKAELENVEESRQEALAGHGYKTPQRAELIISNPDKKSRVALDKLVQLELAVKKGSAYRIKLRRKTIFD